MTYLAPGTRPLVLRARRDTVALTATAAAMTFALAHLVEAHRPAPRPDPPQQAWTGDLAGPVAPIKAAVEPLTSASLVVPQSELALPQPPVRPLVKLRGCGGHPCSSKVAAVPGPVPRHVSEETDVVETEVAERPIKPRRAKPGLMSRLNPFNHLPDASTIKRPFAFASDAVTGWFK